MNKEKMTKRGENGITLIALVITIIVLLILAGVSIAMLTGDNGILTQANEAKTATEQGKVEEMVSVAIGGLRAEYLGDKDQITPQKIAEQVNKDNNRTDVTASSTTFPTDIEFDKEKLKVPVDMDLNVGDSEINEPEDLPIYSEDIDESQIAPTDLFDFQIIQETASNTEVASTGMISSLPQKEARITRIKPEYCNEYGYNPDTGNDDLEDTNYEIKYEGITDTLIIPYQVEINGEMYKITEVDLSVESGNTIYRGTQSLPSIENIIYPNTIKTIPEPDNYFFNYNNDKLKNIVLSKNLTKIPDYLFDALTIEKIQIPSSVTSIGSHAFDNCNLLTKIEIPNSVINIGERAFASCYLLEEINIPTSVITIEEEAFAFNFALKTINIAKPENSIEGAPWQAPETTKINWNYQEK